MNLFLLISDIEIGVPIIDTVCHDKRNFRHVHLICKHISFIFMHLPDIRIPRKYIQHGYIYANNMDISVIIDFVLQ